MSTAIKSPSRILDIQQVSKRFGVHHSTVYRWVTLGILPAIRVNGEIFLKERDLRNFERPKAGRKKFTEGGD